MGDVVIRRYVGITCDGCGRREEIQGQGSVRSYEDGVREGLEMEPPLPRGWRVGGVLSELRPSVPELRDGVTWEDLCPACVDRRALLVLVGELADALDEDDDEEPQARDSLGRAKKKPAAAKAGDKDPDP